MTPEPTHFGAKQTEERSSRWARLAAEIEAAPAHLNGYSDQLHRDSRELRAGFAFQHDRGAGAAATTIRRADMRSGSSTAE